MREFTIDNKRYVNFSPDEYRFLLLLPKNCDLITDAEYEDIRQMFLSRGYDLMYLPKLVESIPQGLVDYYVPEQNGKVLNSYEVVQNRILGELGLTLDSPMALYCDGDGIRGIESEEGDEDTAEFLRKLLEYFDFEAAGECDKEAILGAPDEDFRRDKYDLPLLCEPCDPCGSMPMPGSIPSMGSGEEYQIEQLIEELQELNEEKLMAIGLSESALRFILGHVIPKMSRIRITRHSKIILDDYSGREIKMDDKTKALYFLYLRHPEGLAIKDLQDFKNELLDLYQSISGRDDPDAMRQTIDNLCDPFQNNANISLSRIKKAFCEAIAGQIASNYYVEGERGGVRMISLDRSLVTWEAIR